MKKLLLAMILILGLSVPCLADSTVQISWDPNSESDLAGYNVYQSATSGGHAIGVDIPVATTLVGTETVTITVGDGTWYWVVTAFDKVDNESGPSLGEATATLDSTAPDSPDGVVVITITVIR